MSRLILHASLVPGYTRNDVMYFGICYSDFLRNQNQPNFDEMINAAKSIIMSDFIDAIKDTMDQLTMARWLKNEIADAGDLL